MPASIRLLRSLLALLVPVLAAACGDDDDAERIVVDFEDVSLPAEGALLGESTAPGLAIGEVTFVSTYNSEFDFSSGFAISADTDTTTPGFMNSYSAFPGSGANGSAQYAVWNGQDTAIELSTSVIPVRVQVANTTYAALSMMTGDAFAKMFTAEDQDFFTVIFTGLDGAGNEVGSVEHELADFRTGSNEGIQTGWAPVDLTPLGAVDAIEITFESSDVGSFGINTPLYVAIDDFTYERP